MHQLKSVSSRKFEIYFNILDSIEGTDFSFNIAAILSQYKLLKKFQSHLLLLFPLTSKCSIPPPKGDIQKTYLHITSKTETVRIWWFSLNLQIAHAKF